ncbi:hypothetical protein BGZ99_008922 [Dissophora globulifera]|uniref:Mitochondrial carrier protein n=1 Tax=Dissophora globulifera TaxID=979702 RepID=A0A9P6R9Y1_9FUNG|nr:hypothetical protein BGZ99_008922 [Dissophora globulifera]
MLVDNVRVSIQCSKGIPSGLAPRLERLLSGVGRELWHQQNQKRHFSSGDRLSVYRGLYKGVSFALIFQVPALALFLSTYDATKHAIAYMAKSSELPSFQIHAVETHLLSGMLAKAAGTALWAPMNRIQSLATHPVTGQLPLSLGDAYRIAKQICLSEGASGLWSGYHKTFSALLPYTMIYFATYEQLKMLARWVTSSKADAEDFEHGTQNSHWSCWTAAQEYWAMIGHPDREIPATELTLDVYMACVASSVVLSSAMCQTATAVREAVFSQRASSPSTSSALSSSPTFSTFVETLRKQPFMTTSNSPLSPSKVFPSSFSVIATTGTYNYRHPHFMPAQFRAMMSSASTLASQALPRLPQQQLQHATLATPTLLPFRSTMNHPCLANTAMKGLVHPGSTYSIARANTHAGTATKVQSAYKSYYSHLTPTTMEHAVSVSLNDNEMNRMNHNAAMTTNNTNVRTSQTPGVLRTIARGLGPRILWTVPGVTLTTAGFEVLRNMALGS